MGMVALRSEPGGPDVPIVIQPAAFATKSAKIRSVAAQRIKAAATRAFRIEGLGGKGRMIETLGESTAGTSRKRSQLLRCKANQPILVSNSSSANSMAGATNDHLIDRVRSSASWRLTCSARFLVKTGFAFTFAIWLLASPLATEAQQVSSVPRLGLSVSASAPSSFVEAFRQGLRDLGYVEGTNIALEVRYAEGRSERFPAFMAEFVRLNVRVIVAGGGLAAARAARQATHTIPIVTPSVADPVKDGLVASLAHPGGNFTGLSMMNTEVSGKRVELLKAALPRLTRVAIVREFIPNRTQAEVEEAATAARALGLQSHVVEVRGAHGFDAAFVEVRKLRPDALLMTASTLFNAHRRTLVERVAASRLAAIWENREFAEAGGLLSYGPDILDMYRRAASYVDKILKGAKPADLPVEQPTKFQLVVNLRTARDLGITIPQELLARADQVIE